MPEKDERVPGQEPAPTNERTCGDGSTYDASGHIDSLHVWITGYVRDNELRRYERARESLVGAGPHRRRSCLVESGDIRWALHRDSLRHGRLYYPYHLVAGDLGHVGIASANGARFPMIQVRLFNQALYETGPDELVRRVLKWADLVADIEDVAVSRIALAGDMRGWTPQASDHAFLDGFGARVQASGRALHAAYFNGAGGEFMGWAIGRPPPRTPEEMDEASGKRPISAGIYNKTAQLVMLQGAKDWMRDYLPALSGVWRTEVTYKKEKLVERLGSAEPRYVLSHLPSLWTYFAGEAEKLKSGWLRLLSDDRRSIHPAWLALRAIPWSGTAIQPPSPRERAPSDPVHLVRSGWGIYRKLAAQLGERLSGMSTREIMRAVDEGFIRYCGSRRAAKREILATAVELGTMRSSVPPTSP
jgi:hypothetical protein